MFGLFIELKFSITAIYFLNYHKNVTCSFISSHLCLPSYVTRYVGLLKPQQYIPSPSLSIDIFYIHCYRG